MTVGDIRMKFNANEDSVVKAFVSFCIDDVFVIHDVKVIEYGDGLHVVMPSRKRNSNGQYIDIAHPTNKETRDALEEQILEVYHAEKQKEAEQKETAE